jgi:hypothetical protein
MGESHLLSNDEPLSFTKPQRRTAFKIPQRPPDDSVHFVSHVTDQDILGQIRSLQSKIKQSASLLSTQASRLRGNTPSLDAPIYFNLRRHLRNIASKQEGIRNILLCCGQAILLMLLNQTSLLPIVVYSTIKNRYSIVVTDALVKAMQGTGNDEDLFVWSNLDLPFVKALKKDSNLSHLRILGRTVSALFQSFP